MNKQLLLSFKFSRMGAPFAPVRAKESIQVNGFDFSRIGEPFFANTSDTAVSFPSLPRVSRFGAPFRDVTAKPSINASAFDFSRLGAPFWVEFEGEAPPSYNTAQFFMLF